MTTERITAGLGYVGTDRTARAYIEDLPRYLLGLIGENLIDDEAAQNIFRNAVIAVNRNPRARAYEISIPLTDQQGRLASSPLPYLGEIVGGMPMHEFVAQVEQEPVSQPPPVVEAPPLVDTMTGEEYTEPSPEYAEVTGFERPPLPPQPPETPPIDLMTGQEYGEAAKQQAAAAEKEKYEGQTKDWWKIASKTYLQWLVDANVISNDTMADLITTMNNKLSLLGTDTLSVAQASSNVPFVQEIVKGISKHDFIVKESQAKAQRMAEQQQWARGQESRKLRAEERAAQRAAIQPQGVSGVPKAIWAAEKRQREQALARVPTTGDVYYPFLEEKLSPSMQGYYSGRLGEIMKEFEEAGGGRERKLWAEKESGLAAEKRRASLRGPLAEKRARLERQKDETETQLGDTRKFIKEEGERLRGPYDFYYDWDRLTTIAPTQRGGLEGTGTTVGSEGLRKAYDKEKTLEDKMIAVQGGLKSTRKEIAKEITKEAGADPFQTYLEQYPFLKKYMMLSPRQRGSYPSKYAPKARWVSY